ncbi:hypothetical protein TcBrA4_0139490 [Trypanosoma cruzi]|nr:hypothetical protein TcBrA4_0139490 [Trypanosoma cruzi]
MALPSERRGGRGTDEEVPERVPPVQHGDAAAEDGGGAAVAGCDVRAREGGAKGQGRGCARPGREEAEGCRAAADGAEEEDEAPREKKKPNPLDELPPSPFVLDAFKREYSNTDIRTVAAPYFFQHYDAAGYTTFWCRYKYNEDNKMQFMTANLIRGWFQRMEHVRKYAFGVALIIGEERRHDIVALWVFRGGACRRLWRTWRTRSC